MNEKCRCKEIVNLVEDMVQETISRELPPADVADVMLFQAILLISALRTIDGVSPKSWVTKVVENHFNQIEKMETEENKGI